MNKIYFSEIQRFREIAFFALIWILQILFFVLLTKQLIFHKPVGINPASDLALIIINLLFLAINLLLISIKLITKISETGIAIRFAPFHLKERIILWSEIKEIRIIKYDGIKEYYGYGLRYSPKKGWCYTISGNIGIKLCLKDGKKILIGTHKEKDLFQALNELAYQDLITRDILTNSQV